MEKNQLKEENQVFTLTEADIAVNTIPTESSVVMKSKNITLSMDQNGNEVDQEN